MDGVTSKKLWNKFTKSRTWCSIINIHWYTDGCDLLKYVMCSSVLAETLKSLALQELEKQKTQDHTVY